MCVCVCVCVCVYVYVRVCHSDVCQEAWSQNSRLRSFPQTIFCSLIVVPASISRDYLLAVYLACLSLKRSLATIRPVTSYFSLCECECVVCMCVCVCVHHTMYAMKYYAHTICTPNCHVHK